MTKGRTAGVALLSVIAIAGITGALAYHVISMQSLTIEHSGLSINQDRAFAYALGVEQFAIQKLVEDFQRETERGFDSEIEEWASLLPPLEVPNGEVHLRLIDLMSRFNINSMFDESNAVAQLALERICSELGIDISVAARIRDWIDPNSETVQNGGEDWDYAAFDTPFRTPNQFAADISEVLYFAPMLKETYEVLREHLTVLPTPTLSVNLNTASEVVLASLIPESESSMFLESFVEKERSYDSVQRASSAFGPFAAIEDYLQVRSDFFELHVTVIMENDSRVDLTSTLYRSPTEGRTVPYKRDLSQRHDWTIDEENPDGY